MINVLFGGNKFVFKGWLLCTLSMVKHTKEPINMFFYTMDLSELDPAYVPVTQAQADYIQTILQDVNPESRVNLVDATALFKELLIGSVNLGCICGPYTLLRLLADKFDMPDRFIYLDCDTLINRDLALLYNYDIGDSEMGVVRDAYRISKTYFNAGVLLINHKKCKETGLFEKARELIAHKKMLYADQDALNRSCTQKVMLPLIYNSKDKYYEDIVVHHFCNVRKRSNWFHRIKPWEVELVKTRMDVYNDILDDYVERTKKELYPG